MTSPRGSASWLETWTGRDERPLGDKTLRVTLWRKAMKGDGLGPLWSEPLKVTMEGQGRPCRKCFESCVRRYLP